MLAVVLARTSLYDNLLVNMEKAPVKTILHECPDGESGKPICNQFEY